jgi:alpha-L-fucosidase 2
LLKFLIRFGLALSLLFSGCFCGKENQIVKTPGNVHDLVFNELAKTWDEGIPLGNGMLGALIWQKDEKLRISLDRADLWDLRSVAEFSRPEFSFAWVYNQVLKGDYSLVQQLFDIPYERDPAPTKIPAGALEFDISELGPVRSVRLHLADALCRVVWENGASLEVFVHATDPVGWFKWENIDEPVKPQIVAPPYRAADGVVDDVQNSVAGNDLRRLNYPAPEITEIKQGQIYHQQGWNGFSYVIAVQTVAGNEGAWSVMANPSWNGDTSKVEDILTAELTRGRTASLKEHSHWWHKYWQQSSVTLPDSILERQWYLEQYKFGAASRRGAPPISLQAVWTADNGRIPPWKGDFHHDLNTQLSYWPCYSGNHLEEGLAFLDWLWKIKPTAEAYTRAYFNVDGLNVPGVTTLDGSPMGGWIQYSFGPTVSAWLAHHFYLHWRYSMDRHFLKERAYPWIAEVATFVQNISVISMDGKRKLPISSSPEINDNRIDAWFHETTNFDLALIRWVLSAAAELADELDLPDESSRWQKALKEWPCFAVDPEEGLKFAPDFSYHESHRHFSHLMAFHPLGLIDLNNGPDDQHIIENTIANLEKNGSDWWTGYSFAWLGNLYARARDGEKAAQALRNFADCFCLPNSFHVNGDQSGTGKSKFTYRPFTLEGNFAFAAGILEMLLQSHNGPIRIFPAIPDNWENVSFQNLRSEGAFLISAELKNGLVDNVIVESESGGLLQIVNPFGIDKIYLNGKIINQQFLEGSLIEMTTNTGQKLIFSSTQ